MVKFDVRGKLRALRTAIFGPTDPWMVEVKLHCSLRRGWFTYRPGARVLLPWWQALPMHRNGNATFTQLPLMPVAAFGFRQEPERLQPPRW